MELAINMGAVGVEWRSRIINLPEKKVTVRVFHRGRLTDRSIMQQPDSEDRNFLDYSKRNEILNVPT